jgi:hypothetical protein
MLLRSDQRPVNASRLERWLGAEQAEGIARNTKGWYGPPIPLAGVPGRVFVTGDGDYVGKIHGGRFACLADYAAERYKLAARRAARRVILNTGFASLSDLISEATTGGKRQQLAYQKTGVANPAATYCAHLWAAGAVPAAGANAGAAAGGTIWDNTSAGGLQQADPAGSDTLHFVSWTGVPTTNVGSLMLYDYLFGVNNSLNATNTAVTGVPTRYQDTTAAGSFCSLRVTTVMSATATNLTLTYMDQAGNTAEAAAAIAARVSAAVNTIPLTAPVWFIPLNSPDTGLRKITNVQSSGANTGVADWIIGHPIAILPQYAINIPSILDGINSAFNLAEVKTDACLALMEYFKSALGANSYDGIITLVSG